MLFVIVLLLKSPATFLLYAGQIFVAAIKKNQHGDIFVVNIESDMAKVMG
jgi:hypothetical protein